MSATRSPSPLAQWAHDRQRAPVHRSEAPLPRSPSRRQRERFARARSEQLEHAGQLELDMISPAAASEKARGAEVPRVGRGVRPGVGSASAPPAPGRRPTLEECAARPWLAFD